MIVQCDQCNARFKLDDAKIKENGVKVRCSKCKNVFIVRKETPPDETDFDSLLSGLGEPSPTNTETMSAKSHEESFEVAGQPAAPDEAPEGPREDIPVQDAKRKTVVAEPQSTWDDDDDGDFAFSDEPLAEEQVSMPPADRQETTPEPAEEDDYDFGAVPPEPEANTELPGETAETLDFGEIDFGESVAVAPTEKQDAEIPMAATGKQSVPSAPPSATLQDSAISSLPTADVSHEEAFPSLGVSSRRERTSIVPIILIAIAILFVIALAGAGFYFLNEGPAAFNKLGLGFLAEWAGMGAVEEGGIIVRKPIGTFLVNKEAGEIFVVSGEAVNNFRKPRASIQVKAIIYGPKGEAMQQKVAYCGNPLSREQLESLPMDKIEAAMLNQFGDSLTNLGVQSGKTIPFVVVFTDVPKEAGEFGVEVVGSTVASQ